MIYTHGKPDGAPRWVEFKKDGKRVSFECYDANPKGLLRIYNNDKDTFNVTSTTQKQLAPGWLTKIQNNNWKQGVHTKQFLDDGSISEVETDDNDKPI